MENLKTRKTIREWEVESGIKVKNSKGFYGQKNKILNTKYTREAFLLGIKKSIISITTEKGLDFINGQDVKDEYWRSYIKNSENRRERNERRRRW